MEWTTVSVATIPARRQHLAEQYRAPVPAVAYFGSDCRRTTRLRGAGFDARSLQPEPRRPRLPEPWRRAKRGSSFSAGLPDGLQLVRGRHVGPGDLVVDALGGLLFLMKRNASPCDRFPYERVSAGPERVGQYFQRISWLRGSFAPSAGRRTQAATRLFPPSSRRTADSCGPSSSDGG